MWRKREKPWGTKRSPSTWYVGKKRRFSTRGKSFHRYALTFHKIVWKTPPLLLVPAVDIGGDILDNFRLFWVCFYQSLNAVEGVEDGAVVPVELLADLL